MESQRGKNLAYQLELLGKVIQGRMPEVEPRKEQSMDVGKAEVGKSRDARNLGAVRTGPGNKEK